MSRGEAWFQHGALVLVGGTGLVYGWMRYFAEPGDEFAIVNHPQQPLLHGLHIVTAPLLVFGCALIWRDHVWKRVKNAFPLRRPTGLALAAAMAPMIASGYLLQVSESEFWRQFWIVTHVATSLIWIAGYLAHQLSPRGAPRTSE